MTTIKGYWYCRRHDDAYYMNLRPNIVPNDLCSETICCLSDRCCHLDFIGIRKFDENGDIIEDTTPSQDYYDLCGGGFNRSFLPDVDEIFLEMDVSKICEIL